VRLFQTAFAGLLFFCWPAAAAEDTPPISLRVLAAQSNGWVRIQGTASNYSIVRLEASSNLVHWQTIAELHAFAFEFPDPVSPQTPFRFYRCSISDGAHTNYLKNQIVGFNDAFAAEGDWIKFAILMDDPTRVFYGHTYAYIYHYDFCTNYFDDFHGMDPDTFDDVSLYNVGRKVLLGAVLFPPRANIPEYGVQFVSHDPLSPELVRDMFNLVTSTVTPFAPHAAFYMPAYEQAPAAEADRPWLTAHGVPVSSAERWASADACYSSGWAVGTLKYFTGAEIAAAYADGRLRPTDILLTDGIPAEVPYLAGIITLTPATANSHVVILARSQQVPVVYLWDTSERDRVRQLVGRQIAFQASILEHAGGYNVHHAKVNIHTLDADFDPALMAIILASRNPLPINLQTVTRYGAYTAPTDNLTPADTRFFGGKAANYGLLRRTIPSNAPPAIAVSFDLWLEFMEQTIHTGTTLRQEISNRLFGLTYPADIPRIQTNLAAIRAIVRQNTQFTPAQQQAIITALGVFDSASNIRFRSSSNVEDGETFTGAGLYDSYSGCLDDDLDADNRGPSLCDPTEEDERGVFRAIRRVFASFYNDNAYLERLRRGVDENHVGMALLVHHSTPDANEMANGVATLTTDSTMSPPFRAVLVTQVGATSVTNPDTNALPEIVQTPFPDPQHEGAFDLSQSSSLLQLGEHVMTWPDDYRDLTRLLASVRDAYRQMTGEAGTFILDFEYKKVQPGELQVKQVRKIPLFDTTNRVSTFLLNTPAAFVPYQGFGRYVFTSHRLKSRWTVRSVNTSLNASNFIASPYRDLTIEHLNGARIETLSGPIHTFPNYSNHVSYVYPRFISRDSWRMNTLEGPVDYVLETALPSTASPLTPLVNMRDAIVSVSATYDHLVPTLYRRAGALTSTNRETLGLVPVSKTPDNGSLPDGETLLAFRHGPTNLMFSITSTAGTRRTRIEGFTTDPIVLTNFFSQSADAGHMGGGAEWIFEPRLEPGISARTLAELDAHNIRMLYVMPKDKPGLFLFGRDGSYRRLFPEP
jgi:hypothetical protein